MKKILYGFSLVLFVTVFLSCNSAGNKKKSDENTITDYYGEKYRPQFHFSPQTGWMNDPNGLVFLDGEYHLFYQFYPDSTVWGPMHWGHAVSSDLVHWTHLPVALYPDSLGYIFSGSAVVDSKNTAGFADTENPAIVAIFTYHNPELAGNGSDSYQSQGIAYSTDKGRTWTKYSGNPVLPNPGKRDFRDPKVFWHDGSGKWIMILAVSDRVHIYSSPDLKSWSFESEFGDKAGAHGGVWECPDLFPLEHDGSGTIRWVMLVSINPGGPNGGSATQYFTGDFDGHHFIPDFSGTKWLDMGTDNYAGVTWSGIPENDGRRLFIGWMSNWYYANVVPTTVWRSAMTVPRELSLISRNGDFHLISGPAGELGLLRRKSETLIAEGPDDVLQKEIPMKGNRLNGSELIIDLQVSAGTLDDSLGIILSNDAGEELSIRYSAGTNLFYADRSRSGESAFSKRFSGYLSATYETEETIRIHMFIDASSAEIFVDKGKLVMTALFFPTEEYTRLRFFSKYPGNYPERIDYYELASIWQQ